MLTKLETEQKLLALEVDFFQRINQVLLAIPSFSPKSKSFSAKLNLIFDILESLNNNVKKIKSDEVSIKNCINIRLELAQEFDNLIQYIVNKVSKDNGSEAINAQIKIIINTIAEQQQQLWKDQSSLVKRIEPQSEKNKVLVRDYQKSLDGLAQVFITAFKILDEIYNPNGRFSLLSEELKANIFSYIPGTDAGKLSSVNHSWNQSLNNNSLWKHYCQQLTLFKEQGTTQQDMNYKTQYKKLFLTQEVYIPGLINLYESDTKKTFKSPTEIEFSNLKNSFNFKQFGTNQVVYSFNAAFNILLTWCQGRGTVHSIMKIEMPRKLYDEASEKGLALEKIPNIDQYIVSYTYEDGQKRKVVTINNPSRNVEPVVEEDFSNYTNNNNVRP